MKFSRSLFPFHSFHIIFFFDKLKGLGGWQIFPLCCMDLTCIGCKGAEYKRTTLRFFLKILLLCQKKLEFTILFYILENSSKFT